MRRAIRISAWVAGSSATLVVLLLIAMLIGGNTRLGAGMIERLTYQLTSGNVRLTGLGGSFPSDLTLDRLELVDRGGVWLTAEHIAVRWSPAALLKWHVHADNLQASRVDMERMPLPSPAPGMVSLEDARIELEAHRIDPAGIGTYSLALRFDATRLEGMLSVHEPASGPLENILQLPGLGELSANLAI